MKLGIISDTHGSLGAWDKSLRVLGDVDLLFHAGDVLYHGPRNPLPYGYDTLGLAKAISQYPGRIVIARGNCDADIDVFCKPFFPKVANHFSIVLHLHFPQSCKFHFPTAISGEMDDCRHLVPLSYSNLG
jgi:predicted phosphodiesterase